MENCFCAVFTGKEWRTAHIKLSFQSFKVSSWYNITIISFHFSELLILSVQVLARFSETRKQLYCQYNKEPSLHYSASPPHKLTNMPQVSMVDRLINVEHETRILQVFYQYPKWSRGRGWPACGRLERQTSARAKTSARLKITFVDMTYPKGWTESLPLCLLIFS